MIPLGVFRSPLSVRRGIDFEKRRQTALAAVEPVIMGQLTRIAQPAPRPAPPAPTPALAGSVPRLDTRTVTPYGTALPQGTGPDVVGPALEALSLPARFNVGMAATAPRRTLGLLGLPGGRFYNPREILEAEERLHPAARIAGGLVADPLNLVPGLGFTKVPRLARAGGMAARAGAQAGRAGVRATAPTARRLLAEEAGGRPPRKPPVEPPTGGVPLTPAGAPPPGTRVRAADRGNIGTVSHYDENGRAYVYFRNRKKGLQKTVPLWPNRLEPVGKGARRPTGGMPPPQKPPRKPPAPPTEPPLGGVPPTPPEDPIRKLTTAIRSAGESTPGQRAMFAQERMRRTGQAAGILERGIAAGKGREAFYQSRGALAGEFARPQFAVPEFTDADVHQLIQHVGTADLPYYSKLSAQDALEELARGRIPQPAQLQALKQAFPQGGDDLIKAVLDKRSLGEKAMAEAVSFIGLPQKFKSSFDFGTRFRQGMVLGWSHPRQWLSNWKPVLNSMFSEQAAQDVMSTLEKNPWYSIQQGERAGLGFTDLDGHIYRWGEHIPGTERVEGFQGMNPSFINRVTDRIPGIKNSQRSFAVDLNKQGVEVYAQEAEAMWNAGVRDPDQYRALVSVINHARGYGAFNAGQIGKGVSAFFSGRNLVARFQVALDPIMQPGSLLKPSARQLAAKNLVGLIAGEMSLLGLIGTIGAATGIATVAFDPRKSGADWLKVRIGNTRIDPWGGFIPMARLIAHMGLAAATETGLAETDYDLSRVKRELTTFFTNKEAPLVRQLTDAVGISEPFGDQKFLSPETLAEIYAPFVSEDVWEAVKEHGWKGAAAGPVAVPGIAVQTYELPSERLRAARTEVMEEKGVSQEEVDQDPTLKAEIDADPRVKEALAKFPEGDDARSQYFEAVEETREEQRTAQAQDDAAFQAGTMEPATWVERYKDRSTEFANRRDQIQEDFEVEFKDKKYKPGTVGKAIEAYFAVDFDDYTDPDTGETDWDAGFAAREKALAGLTPAEKKRVNAYLQRYDTPLVKEFKAASKLKSEYYDKPKYVGLKADQGHLIDDFIDEVKDIRDAMSPEQQEAIPVDATVRQLAQQKGAPEAFVKWVTAIRKKPELFYNQERVDFLLKPENRALLRLFFPNLYDLEVVEQAMREQGLEVRGAFVSAEDERARVLNWQGDVSGALQSQGVSDPEALRIALAIMGAESGGNPSVPGDNGQSLGLYQIHNVHGIPAQQRLDPSFNIQWAVGQIAPAYQQARAMGLTGDQLVRFVYDRAINPGAYYLPQGDRVVGWYRALPGGQRELVGAR